MCGWHGDVGQRLCTKRSCQNKLGFPEPKLKNLSLLVLIRLYVRKGFDPPPVICGCPKKLLLTGVTSPQEGGLQIISRW